jgi:hypothetical protein
MAIIVIVNELGSLESLDEGTLGRLQYAFLMVGRRRSTRIWYARLLRRDRRSCVPIQFWLALTALHLGRVRLAALLYRRISARDDISSEANAAKTLAAIMDLVTSKQIFARIEAFVDKLMLGQGESILLVPVGSNFSELFWLWLEQARKHVGSRIVGVTLDQAAASLVGHALEGNVLDLSSFFVFTDAGTMHPHSKKMLWLLRVLLLREIVGRGHTVTSMDLDALVLGDVGAMLSTFPKADIVAQQDYSAPVDVARKQGFILCCGFMIFCPTPATRQFLNRYAERTMLELDDQLALNHLIAEAGVSAKTIESHYFSFQAGGVRWLCPDRTLVSRDIAYGKVIRHFQQTEQTIAELRGLCGI